MDKPASPTPDPSPPSRFQSAPQDSTSNPRNLAHPEPDTGDPASVTSSPDLAIAGAPRRAPRRRRRRTSDEPHSQRPPPRVSPAVDSDIVPSSKSSPAAESVAAAASSSHLGAGSLQGEQDKEDEPDEQRQGVSGSQAGFSDNFSPSEKNVQPPFFPDPATQVFATWASYPFNKESAEAAPSTPSSTGALIGSEGEMSSAYQQDSSLYNVRRHSSSEVVTPNGTYGGHVPLDPPLAEIRPGEYDPPTGGVWSDYIGPGGYGPHGNSTGKNHVNSGINDSIMAWQGMNSQAGTSNFYGSSGSSESAVPGQTVLVTPTAAKQSHSRLPLLRSAANIRSSAVAWDPSNVLLEVEFRTSSSATPPASASDAVNDSHEKRADIPSTSLQPLEGQVQPISPAPTSAPPPIDHETMLALLPHPHAYFSPSTLEWLVIVSAQDFLKNQEPPHQDNDDESAPLYTIERNVVVESDLQRVPVQLASNILPKPANESKQGQQLRRFTLLSDVASGVSEPALLDRAKRVYVSEADAIPSVLNKDLLLSVRAARTDNPPPGQQSGVYFDRAMRLILRILATALGGNSKAVVVSSKTFTQRLGWDESVSQLFASLGWNVGPVSDEDSRSALRPPPRMLGREGYPTPIWKLNGRAWVELSLWAQHSRHLFGVPEDDPPQASDALTWFPFGKNAKSAIDLVLGFKPYHVDPSLPLGPAQEHIAEAARYLGVDPQEEDRTIRAMYYAQCQRLPEAAPLLLSSVEYFVNEQRKEHSFDLQILLSEERSSGRWTFQELERSMVILGLEGIEIDQMDQLDPSVISTIYQDRIKQLQNGDFDAMTLGTSSSAEELRHALNVVSNAMARPSALEQQLGRGGANASTGQLMSLDAAYTLLQAPEAADDDSLAMLYSVRLDDDPDRASQWRDALLSIAQARGSESLLRLTRGEASSAPEGPAAFPLSLGPAAREDLPAGLNNIGNTCYLNSVLQYFFSVSDIRTRVIEYASTVKQLTPPAELPRVGGRQITLRELERSHDFIHQLASLFQSMISWPAPSVTPERELAYLALVSSRAEEQAGAVPAPQPAPAPTDPSSASGSHKTEATLVDVSMSSPPAQSAQAVPDTEDRNSLMQLGAQEDVTECLDNVVFQLECGLGLAKTTGISTTQAHDQDLIDFSDCSEEGSGGKPQGMSLSEDAVAENQDLGNDAGCAAVTSGHPTLLSSLFEGETAQRLQEVPSGRSGLDTPDQEPGPVLSSLNESSQDSRKDVKKEVFRILPIDVPPVEGRDVYDGLDGFFDEEVIDATPASPSGSPSATGSADNHREKKKRWIRRSVELTRAPPILQLQLQRVQFDRNRGRLFKSQAHVELYENIFLDRYVRFNPSVDPEDTPRLAKRRLARRLRAEAQQLRERATFLRSGQVDKGASTSAAAAAAASTSAAGTGSGRTGSTSTQPDKSGLLAQSLRETADMLSFWIEHQRDEAESVLPEVSDTTLIEVGGSEAVPNAPPPETHEDGLLTGIEVASTLPDDLRREADEVRERLKAIDVRLDEIRRESVELWADENRFEYVLAALFMHRGEATHGHYFLNQRNLGRPDGEEKDIWFKYNDSQVTAVSAKDVLCDPTGANPYLVCYVRKDVQNSLHLIQTLCRQLASPPPPEGPSGAGPEPNGGSDVILGAREDTGSDLMQPLMPSSAPAPAPALAPAPASAQVQTQALD